MKAVRIIDGAPTLVDAPPPDADGVRVTVTSTSICGSDLHLIDAGFAEGRVLGHEFAGTTPDGTPVAVEPTLGCGHCTWCVDGVNQHCDEGTRFVGVSIDGGMAEEVVVPPSALVELPSGLDLANACLVEPLAVAVRAVNRAPLEPGQPVLVAGAGPIGLAAVAVLTHRGVATTVIARHDHQRAAAERLGATVVDEAAGPAAKADRYPVVIDAVATPDSFATSVRSVRPLGTIVLVGTPWQPISLDVGAAMAEITVIPSMTYGGTGDQREFAQAVDVLAADTSVADTLITHRFPLDGAAEGFATSRQRGAGAIKVVFEP